MKTHDLAPTRPFSCTAVSRRILQSSLMLMFLERKHHRRGQIAHCVCFSSVLTIDILLRTDLDTCHFSR